MNLPFEGLERLSSLRSLGLTFFPPSLVVCLPVSPLFWAFPLEPTARLQHSCTLWPYRVLLTWSLGHSCIGRTRTYLSQPIHEGCYKYLVVGFVDQKCFLIEAGYVGSQCLILPLPDGVGRQLVELNSRHTFQRRREGPTYDFVCYSLKVHQGLKGL